MKSAVVDTIVPVYSYMSALILGLLTRAEALTFDLPVEGRVRVLADRHCVSGGQADVLEEASGRVIQSAPDYGGYHRDPSPETRGFEGQAAKAVASTVLDDAVPGQDSITS